MVRKLLLIASLLLIVGAIGISTGRLPHINFPFKQPDFNAILPDGEKVRIVSEESIVIDVVKKLRPSVVTVGVERTRGFFGQQPRLWRGEAPKKEEADIGSGFIVASDGLVVTNKHVVEQTGVKYKVITYDNKTYEVKNIYRDPANDVAILKIDPPTGGGLTAVEMGDSSKLEAGQLVVAMGTPLGEFRGTVTSGIVSGLGRGITAGSPVEGYAEKLDDVIQTDAAINPGNSGGPLVNSSAQVIGINTAVASGAENIGFALPIQLVKDAIGNFNSTGKFERAFLGVSYKTITKDLAILNDVPEGAYVQNVVSDAAADKAGIEQGDIITHFDGERVSGEDGLSKMIGKKKVGDTVKLTIWRDGKEEEKSVELGEYKSE